MYLCTSLFLISKSLQALDISPMSVSLNSLRTFFFFLAFNSDYAILNHVTHARVHIYMTHPRLLQQIVVSLFSLTSFLEFILFCLVHYDYKQCKRRMQYCRTGSLEVLEDFFKSNLLPHR